MMRPQVPPRATCRRANSAIISADPRPVDLEQLGRTRRRELLQHSPQAINRGRLKGVGLPPSGVVDQDRDRSKYRFGCIEQDQRRADIS